MPLYTKPGDAWQEPEHIRSQQPDGTMQEVEVVRAKVGSEYVDVWPEYQQAVHYLMLYDHGDECTEVTGGWGFNEYQAPYGSASKNQDNMHFTSSLGATVDAHTKQAIDFTEYARFYGLASGKLVTYRANGNIYTTSARFFCAGNATPYKQESTSGTEGAVYKQYTKEFLSTDIQPGSIGECVAYVAGNSGTFMTMYCAFAVKSDDWQTWLSKAGLSATSLDDVMSDVVTLTTLLSSWGATHYMLRQCTGTVMASAIQSAAFQTELEASPYKDKIYANTHWAKFLAMV